MCQLTQLDFVFRLSTEAGTGLVLDGRGYVKYDLKLYRKVTHIKLVFTANSDGNVFSLTDWVSNANVKLKMQGTICTKGPTQNEVISFSS